MKAGNAVMQIWSLVCRQFPVADIWNSMSWARLMLLQKPILEHRWLIGGHISLRGMPWLGNCYHQVVSARRDLLCIHYL